MITLLTLTGDRQHMFPRQERYMTRQTLPGRCEWVVVDDGVEPTLVAQGQRHIRMEPGKPPKESFAANLRAGLHACRRADVVFFIEDDDWYGPDYLANLLPLLTHHELAGESHAHYYNVEHQRYRVCNNTSHASLCQTAIRGTMIPALLSLVDEQSAFVDMRLWKQDVPKQLVNTRNCIGLKGQGGREGIGMGHRPKEHWPQDPTGSTLVEWIGHEDASEVMDLGNLARRQRAERG